LQFELEHFLATTQSTWKRYFRFLITLYFRLN
jgi:hypothetical protein